MLPLRHPTIPFLVLFIFFFLLLFVLFPSAPAPQAEAKSAPAVLSAPHIPEGYLILDTADGKIIEVDTEEFIAVNVALELDPHAPMEALKAQAIASRSCFESMKLDNISQAYHFSCNSEEAFVWVPEDHFKGLWGEDYEKNMEKIQSAVKETEGQMLYYEGSIAHTAYFPMSCGLTLSDPQYPYLISVASPYDSLSPYFEDEKTFTPEEVKEICQRTWPEGKFDFQADHENWFRNIVYSTGSTVYSVDICGFGVTGQEAREAFDLASTAFTLEYTDGKFHFHTRGLGHGVGMSQQGALQMAAMGSSCEEILAWYFPGTVVSK